MLAAGTLPIRVPATVHALHLNNLMQGKNENEDGDNDADDGVVSDNAAAMQMIQVNIEAVLPICDEFTILITSMMHCFRYSYNRLHFLCFH
jgi:hypothetical protein